MTRRILKGHEEVAGEAKAASFICTSSPLVTVQNDAASSCRRVLAKERTVKWRCRSRRCESCRRTKDRRVATPAAAGMDLRVSEINPRKDGALEWLLLTACDARGEDAGRAELV